MMAKRIMQFATACLVWMSCLVSARAADEARAEFFERRIRPVLVEHCYSCHSAKAKSIKGGLRLDSRAASQTGGDSGPAVVPGKPDESLLLTALLYEDLQMPPKGKLRDSVIADFQVWIADGAFDPRDGAAPAASKVDFREGLEFWAFKSPVQAPQPDVQDAEWPRRPLDHFVLAKLEAEGLRPSRRADRQTLIRRATFNLLGLPPTPEEVEFFVNDSSPDAWDRLITRLLESPHYGERWGRHWLDVARYAEDQAHTFKARKYPRGYFYRDWVVGAFNSDMPYNEFIRQQIAGDLMDGDDRHERIAPLGLFALGPVYYAENVEKDKATADEWDDRVDTLTRGVLGLTVSCARCHDHKYDPITMEDYYGLAGIFANTAYMERPIVADSVVAARRAAEADVKEQQLEIDQFLSTSARALRPQLVDQIPTFVRLAWQVTQTKGKRDKVIEQVAKKHEVSKTLLTRWVAYFEGRFDRTDVEVAILKRWKALPQAAEDESVDALGKDFQQEVRSQLPRTQELFAEFGEAVAFVRPEDVAIVPPGVIPLGNLFDDADGVSLASALATDRYKAVATTNSLGVERVLHGWGTRTRIAPDVSFDFGKLGSDDRKHGSVTNDSWGTGGLSTTGKRRGPSQRTEQGIGMHANALITFDLDEIRRAGILPPDNTFQFHVDRAGISDEAIGSNASAYVAVIVSRPHKDKAVTDAILAAQVNGHPVEVDVDDFTYYFSGELPNVVRGDGQHVRFDVAIPAEAKHLTLVTCGAGEPDTNTINSDHTVFSGARLEYKANVVSDPVATKTSADSPTKRTAEDRAAAMLLSRMLYDEGLLAVPPNEVERYLSEEPRGALADLKNEKKRRETVVSEIKVPLAHAVDDKASVGDLRIYLQGNPAKKGEVAPRAMPAIFTLGEKRAFESPGSGRQELAERIASSDNPLTARVIVNRVWAGHFGHGIVRTTSNFGMLGDRPSHPELLDWLASEFMKQGWSLKWLHREILRSAAWQQASDFSKEAFALDPENRLIWRMNRRRLEIEPWRDSLLAVTGELDRSFGGASISLGDVKNKRRTLYGFVSRHRLDELLRLFDFPDPNITAASRSVTTVPLQQLFVLNSDFMAARAKALTARLEQDQPNDMDARVAHAYSLLFGRAPTSDELQIGKSFLASDVEEGVSMSRWEQYALALLSSNEFFYVD